MSHSIIKNKIIIPIFLLLIFFIAGLSVYTDYGATADETIQIQAGHIIWRYICLKFGFPVPEALAGESDLHGFKNSYYGQAAIFPTVIIEALNGFRLDSSTIIRIRHLWNFLSYFAGLCLFTITLYFIYDDWLPSTLGLLFIVLLPRIFGDIFYNDRDVMLISWMMISISSFYWVIRKPGKITLLLCAAAFGISFNTRIFGLVLLIFPFLFFIFSNKRKRYIALAAAALIFWFVFSPIAWENPVRTIPRAFIHLATQQRSIDTNNGAELLFFGRKINETNLPWYYIPVYMFITTPVMTTAAAVGGVFAFLRRFMKKKYNTRDLISLGMIIILISVQLVGIIFHLTFYDGWRHFYFLYLPVVWFAVEGIAFAAGSENRVIRIGSISLLAVSFFFSLLWIIQVHPYQIIYLNPMFRNHWIGHFDRDYWDLSSKEGIDFLSEYSDDIAIHVTDNHWIDLVLLGQRPEIRNRIHTYPYKIQPYPIEYLFFNYKNAIGNEMKFDFYVPIYSIERDGIKLSEVFQRSHFGELNSAEIIEGITSSSECSSPDLVVDGDYDTFWKSAEGPSELIIHFREPLLLSGIEIFPEDNLSWFPSIKLSSSDDGINWIHFENERKGTNGFSLPTDPIRWIKINSSVAEYGIREILFYGR